MQLTNTISKVKFVAFIAIVFFVTKTQAQENSPYSRYGLGDLQSNSHALSRGMGGVSIAYADGQIVNFANPAALANLRIVTYDIALSIDTRTLVQASPVSKFKSTNFSPSYVSIGMPLDRKKEMGFAFGFRPLTKINYSILKAERTSIDSMQTLYEGSGGLNQLFFGVGKRWKGLSVGIMSGYNFGRKETSTKRTLSNDTVVYHKSNYATTTTFAGAFLTAGLQYEVRLDTVKNIAKNVTEKYFLRLAATNTLSQSLKANQKFVKQSFVYDNSGGVYVLDSVLAGSNVKGTVKVPSTFTTGFQLQKTITDANAIYDVWSIGAEYTASNWSNYKFYDQTDAVSNSWQLKFGGQWMPNPKDAKNYFSRVNYRAGFSIGKDYINADGKGLKTFGVSLGFGLPVRPARYSYQFTTIHTAFEFGKRGSSANNVTENYFRFSFAMSLSDIWFIKRRYD